MVGRPNLALCVALATVAAVVTFIAVAMTGADLCLWCR